MEECYLCGVFLDDSIERSDDHIPPKSLFGSGVEQITVPCCRPCNQEYELLDEHFKTQFSFLSTNVPEKVRTKSLRALTMQEADDERMARMRRSKYYALQIEEVEVKGQQRFKMNFDMEKLNKWLSRIIKGYVYHDMQLRIPDDVRFRTMDRNDIGLPEQLTSMLLDDTRSAIFWCSPMTEEIQKAWNPNAETWMFVFYRTLFFVTELY